MITCTARDLLRLPSAGGGTVFALPDKISTATVINAWDEGWRNRAISSTAVGVTLRLDGPARDLGARELMTLIGAQWAEYGTGTVGLPGTLVLPLLAAVRHDRDAGCVAEPGRTCQMPWNRVCRPATPEVVTLPAAVREAVEGR